MDKELKIAVARPAFKTRESLIEKVDLAEKPPSYFKRKKPRKAPKTTPATTTVPDVPQYANNYDAPQSGADYSNYDEYTYDVNLTL